MKTLKFNTEQPDVVCSICAPDCSTYYRKVARQHLQGCIRTCFMPGDYQIDIIQEAGSMKPQEVMRALKYMYRLAGAKLFCSMYEQDRKIHILASYEDRIDPGEILLTLLHQNPRCNIRIAQTTQKRVDEYAKRMAESGRRRLLELNRSMEEPVWKR